MAPSVVKEFGNGNTSGDRVTATATVTAGNALFALCIHLTGTATLTHTISDDTNNEWVQIYERNATSDTSESLYYVASAVGGSTMVTSIISDPGKVNCNLISILEVTGHDSTTPIRTSQVTYGSDLNVKPSSGYTPIGVGADDLLLGGANAYVGHMEGPPEQWFHDAEFVPAATVTSYTAREMGGAPSVEHFSAPSPGTDAEAFLVWPLGGGSYHLSIVAVQPSSGPGSQTIDVGVVALTEAVQSASTLLDVASITETITPQAVTVVTILAVPALTLTETVRAATVVSTLTVDVPALALTETVRGVSMVVGVLPLAETITVQPATVLLAPRTIDVGVIALTLSVKSASITASLGVVTETITVQPATVLLAPRTIDVGVIALTVSVKSASIIMGLGVATETITPLTLSTVFAVGRVQETLTVLPATVLLAPRTIDVGVVALSLAPKTLSAIVTVGVITETITVHQAILGIQTIPMGVVALSLGVVTPTLIADVGRVALTETVSPIGIILALRPAALVLTPIPLEQAVVVGVGTIQEFLTVLAATPIHATGWNPLWSDMTIDTYDTGMTIREPETHVDSE